MKPSRTDEDAVVDLLDVILRDGVVVEADLVISVADIPLVGVKLRAAVAGMTTMTEYGMFESFDRAHRARAMEGTVQREPVSRVDGEVPADPGEVPADPGEVPADPGEVPAETEEVPVDADGVDGGTTERNAGPDGGPASDGT